MVDGRTIIGCSDAVAESPAAGRGAGRRPLHVLVRRVLLAGASAAALVSAGPSVPARAQQGQGSLDVRCGVGTAGGTVSISLGEGNAMAAAIARTADGKLVVVGNHDAGGSQHVVVFRYGPDGTLDGAFGADGGADGTPDGVVDVSLGAGDDVATAVAVQPDGKILVAGHHVERASSDIFLLRLDAAGAPDAGFGTAGDGLPDGVFIVSLGDGDDVLRGVVAAADGTIVVAGDSMRGENADIVVARFAPDGTPDASFGANGGAKGKSMPDGFVSIDLAAGDDRADALALAPDGSILVAGSHVADDGADIVVVRLTASGVLDAGFGKAQDGMPDGVVAVSPGDGDYTASAIAIASDGKIVVAGTSVARDGSTNFVVARLNADGTPDAGLGAGEGPGGTPDGFVATSLGDGDDVATALALQAEGAILVGGYHQDGDSTSMAVARYTASGTLDAAFGGARSVLNVSLGDGDDKANGMVLDGDGLLVLAGSTTAHAGGRSDIALVRLPLD
ncbi:hypothetical protein [Aquibium sp. ELW1220]|uniref:hypothetical protein n=1 Tax=Aquibium sp. ELW1220 TaxID=2976766 RepID=UPI0025B17950|nr:hypothetical protein [Aquibium sp. ELW1220]MDN2578651.1 hypothetical protein [Aquibium sp. ELW1220]